MNRPNLYIFCGIPFSGKTTLAKKLVSKLGFVRVDLDEIKFVLFGKGVTDEQIDQSGWDEVYQQMYSQIEKLLRQGKTVICDTGNFTKYERGLFKKIADKLGIKAKTVFIDIPKKIAKQRFLENKLVKNRFDISERSFEEAVAEMEPPTQEENVIVYDGKTDINKWIRFNFN